MVVLTKKKGESTDKLFRRFTKITKEENIIFDVNKKIFFKNKKELKKEKAREKAKVRANARKYYENNKYD